MPEPRSPELGPESATEVRFRLVGADGTAALVNRMIAEETPIAIELNGLGYAVLMATEGDLEDFAFGFARSERLIDSADQIVEIDMHRSPLGMIVRITLSPDCASRVFDRVRHRTSEAACGLCGIENLEQAMRPLPHLRERPPIEDPAIFASVEALSGHQRLNALTGGVHAAALCTARGDIRLIREDVGRHNAFDKLIGAMTRAGLDWDGGFALLSSRCSYELVEKAALAGCATLVTVSAPTSLAVRRAQEANIDLVVLARSDSLLRVCR